MWQVIYYTRRNGRTPAQEWIEDQDNSIKPSIDARIEKLRTDGLLLRESGMLARISEKPGGKVVDGFYELRDVARKWRLAVYHDLNRNAFVLIHGWRKSQRIQKRDVQKALTLLDEYLSGRGM